MHPSVALDPTRRIRPVERRELSACQAVEIAAAQCFASVGMPEVAADPPLAISVLDRYRRAGLAWVALGPDGEVSAYLLAEPLDDGLHVEQVSVHPAHARRGIGRALLDHAAARASRSRAAALTLTTFEHVPWNAPYYRRCGFRVLDQHEWSPGMRSLRAREAEHGLERWPRVSMRKEVSSGPEGRGPAE